MQGELITKSRIKTVIKTFSKEDVSGLKMSIITKLGVPKMKKMGKKNVMKVMRKALSKKAIQVLKDYNY